VLSVKTQYRSLIADARKGIPSQDERHAFGEFAFQVVEHRDPKVEMRRVKNEQQDNPSADE
jgi:hypothetical protein